MQVRWPKIIKKFISTTKLKVVRPKLEAARKELESARNWGIAYKYDNENWAITLAMKADVARLEKQVKDLEKDLV